jgi:hypothetical protein
MGALRLLLTPILRMRVRCVNDHVRIEYQKNKRVEVPDPWLRNLFVLWAAPSPEPAEREDADPPRFSLARTDDAGYLVSADSNQFALFNLALIKGHKYLFYFIRHPDIEFARKMRDDLKDYNAGVKIWGEPQSIEVEQEPTAPSKDTGKGKKGKGKSVEQLATIQELMIKIPENPAIFLPEGSDLYEKWVLYREMPGTRGVDSQNQIQCDEIRKHVERLQFHLGSLRYNIGSQWHPYSPLPDKSVTGCAYDTKTEGRFDIRTWNGVLAFQNDARAGNAKQLLAPEKAPTRSVLLDKDRNPTADARNRRKEVLESPLYLIAEDADQATASADIDPDPPGFVGKNTGDAIEQWLGSKLRKPGKILVGRLLWDWMQEDAWDAIQRLDAELKRFQFPRGVWCNSTYRDADAKVGKKGGSRGMARRSIHKSGFAFDFHMTWDPVDNTKSFLTDVKSYPLYWVKNDPPENDQKSSKVTWTVYAHVKRTLQEEEYGKEGVRENPPGKEDPAYYLDQTMSPPRGIEEKAFIQYVDSIYPWIYDAYSPDGGTVGAEKTAGEGYAFLNFTTLCSHFNLVPISAHDSGWQIGKPYTFKVATSKEFNAFMAEFGKIMNLADKSPDSPVVINSTQTFALSDLKDFYNYLSAWFRATSDLDPTPQVTISYPPKDKKVEEQQTMALKMLRADYFDGREAEVVLEGKVPEGKDRVSKVGLGPKAEFPENAGFVLRPVLTDPADLSPLSQVELPALDNPGDPSAMEWWHFQFRPGYTEAKKNKAFGDILKAVGWTKEALLMIGFSQLELDSPVDLPLPQPAKKTVKKAGKK